VGCTRHVGSSPVYLVSGLRGFIGLTAARVAFIWAPGKFIRNYSRMAIIGQPQQR